MTDHGGHGSRAKTVVSMCAACRYHERVVSRQIRLNERRLALGVPVDLTLIARSREDMKRCERCHPVEAS